MGNFVTVYVQFKYLSTRAPLKSIRSIKAITYSLFDIEQNNSLKSYKYFIYFEIRSVLLLKTICMQNGLFIL